MDNQLPWNLILIGLLYWLIILVLLFYIYLNNRKLKQLQEEADKKVGSLKSDLEGRLKDTSEQIKSVGRAAARSGQSGTHLKIKLLKKNLKHKRKL